MLNIVRETHTTFQHHSILVVQTAEQVVPIQKLVLEGLFTLTEVLQKFTKVLVPMI